MTRRYDDPVDVRCSNAGAGAGSSAGSGAGAGSGEPVQFLWRGRLYVVREVLGHWVEVRPWWRAGAARALLGTDTPGISDTPGVSDASELSGALALAARPVASAVALSGVADRARDRAVDEGEREVWRVEAGAGRLHGTGVYDLCLDPVEGTWSLARALD